MILYYFFFSTTTNTAKYIYVLLGEYKLQIKPAKRLYCRFSTSMYIVFVHMFVYLWHIYMTALCNIIHKYSIHTHTLLAIWTNRGKKKK